MNKKTAEFVIYIINEIAAQQNISTAHVHHILDTTGYIQNHLVRFYDVMHTMGTEAIMDDARQYVENRGAQL